MNADQLRDEVTALLTDDVLLVVVLTPHPDDPKRAITQLWHPDDLDPVATAQALVTVAADLTGERR